MLYKQLIQNQSKAKHNQSTVKSNIRQKKKKNGNCL